MHTSKIVFLTSMAIAGAGAHAGALRSNARTNDGYSPMITGCFDDDTARYGPDCALHGQCGDCANLRDRIADGADVSLNCGADAGKYCKKSCNKCDDNVTYGASTMAVNDGSTGASDATMDYSGASGAMDYSGASGAMDYSGASGASGAMDYSGASGASGAMDYSGASGAMDYSGASGASGAMD